MVMVIEWLKFRVAPELREKFIQDDEMVWTAALTKFPGYLGKEVWIDPKAPEEIVIISHWETVEKWQSIPQTALNEIEKQFAEKMGKDNYKLLEFRQYQIRKFPTK
jgi:uncharacterized protein (TIGR03792 family)